MIAKLSNTATAPRIYVGTYAKYNNGSIRGEWIDLDGHDKESFYEACRKLHADEEDPEFMFQDYEGFPASFYCESGFDADFWDWLELVENDRQMLAMYCEAIGQSGTIEEARDAFNGIAASEAEFTEELADEIGAVSPDLANWIVIDWQASWDCNLCHDYSTARDEGGKIWFFHI